MLVDIPPGAIAAGVSWRLATYWSSYGSTTPGASATKEETSGNWSPVAGAAVELISWLQESEAERNEEEVEDEEGKLPPPVAWYEFVRKSKSSTTELQCWL
jgi:hypothetical protein